MPTALLHRRVWTVLAVVLALVGVFGLQAVSPQRAEAREPGNCGGGCNGKSPFVAVTKLDGRTAVCSTTQRAVEGPIYPLYDPLDGASRDPYIVIFHMYSAECATSWLLVRNTKATGRRSCQMWEKRIKTPVYETTHKDCPAAGTEAVTTMVNDYMPDSSVAAQGTVVEQTFDGFYLSQTTAPY